MEDYSVGVFFVYHASWYAVNNCDNCFYRETRCEMFDLVVGRCSLGNPALVS